MFTYFYASTKDRKGHTHQYKLQTGEGVPSGHEITDLSVAGRFKLSEIVDSETAQKLNDLFPKKKRNAKA